MSWSPQVPLDLLKDPRLTDSEVRVLIAILAHIRPADGVLTCWPSNLRIAELTGKSVRSVERGVSSLESKSYVSRIIQRFGQGKTKRTLAITLPYKGWSVTSPDELPDENNKPVNSDGLTENSPISMSGGSPSNVAGRINEDINNASLKGEPKPSELSLADIVTRNRIRAAPIIPADLTVSNCDKQTSKWLEDGGEPNARAILGLYLRKYEEYKERPFRQSKNLKKAIAIIETRLETESSQLVVDVAQYLHAPGANYRRKNAPEEVFGDCWEAACDAADRGLDTRKRRADAEKWSKQKKGKKMTLGFGSKTNTGMTG